MANKLPQLVKSFTGNHKVKYDCPKCGESLVNPLSQAGLEDSCPKCRQSFIVPGKHFKDQIEAEQTAEKQRRESEALQKQKSKVQAASMEQKLQEPAIAAAKEPLPPKLDPPLAKNPSKSQLKIFDAWRGNIIIALLFFFGTVISLQDYFVPAPSWEYRTIEVDAKGSGIALGGNYAALESRKIGEFEIKLSEFGKVGWELVAVFLEHETTHPNFGKEDYVTGLQPNFRPQRLVCILKRQRQ